MTRKYKTYLATVSSPARPLVGAAIGVAVASGSMLGSATISWTAPTTNSAGQSFDNSSNDRTLAGYRIYYGTNEAQVIAGTSASVTDSASPATISGLTSGTWYFRVVAYDGDGDESLNVDTYTKVIP